MRIPALRDLTLRSVQEALRVVERHLTKVDQRGTNDFYEPEKLALPKSPPKIRDNTAGIYYDAANSRVGVWDGTKWKYTTVS